MRPDHVPVLNLLRETLGFQNQRQSVIADNVANANTPGYTPKDLDQAAFHRELQAQLRSGTAALETARGERRTWQTEDRPDTETTVNGNSVVLEEQMIKAAETRQSYETALSLYQKSLGMLRMAVRTPGG
ncbi:flagellar basal body protein [Maricaulis sp. D1M11]|uniref:flagellar basal body protein n=1 Tax=Maricaulis sp. D1M11 TaxID=3076117 RepID=UPI0039B3F4FB